MRLVILLCLVALAVCQSPYQVVHLSEYMRHGARTTWKNSLNSTLTQELGIGNLTGNGVRMHYVLGTQLRKDYPSLFNDEYNYKDFDILSSPVYRTIQSASSQLLALYPLGTGEKYTLPSDSNLGLPPFAGAAKDFESEFALPHGYRPIPYTVENPELDMDFFPSLYHYCPNAEKYEINLALKKLEQYKNKPIIQNLREQMIALGFDSKAIYGTETWNVDTMSYIYDEAKSIYNYNLTYLGNMTAEYFRQIELDNNLNYAWLFADEKLERFISDGIARRLVNGLEAIVNNKSQVKFRMFSGHDTGIFAHMLRLNLTNEECILKKLHNESSVENCQDVPEFAATMLYELNKKGDQYYVRSLFNGKPFKVCETNEDEYYCLFKDFKATIQQKLYYQQNDRIEFCGNTEAVTNKDNEDEHFGFKVGIYICCALLVVALIAFGWIYFQIRKLQEDSEGYTSAGDTDYTPKSNFTLDTVTNTP